MKTKTFKIRFVEDNNKYTLQIKNFFGIWRTQTERKCSDGGCFNQPCTHKDKEVLLNYIILDKYWANRRDSIIEYPTIKKYKLHGL